jgi:hypothetical protein
MPPLRPQIALAAQKLRSLLARCPEWADDAARMRLADTLDASPASSADTGGGRLTSCLRGTDTSACLSLFVCCDAFVQHIARRRCSAAFARAHVAVC